MSCCASRGHVPSLGKLPVPPTHHTPPTPPPTTIHLSRAHMAASPPRPRWCSCVQLAHERQEWRPSSLQQRAAFWRAGEQAAPLQAPQHRQLLANPLARRQQLHSLSVPLSMCSLILPPNSNLLQAVME